MAITATWTEESRERTGRKCRVSGQFALTGSASAGGFAVSASTFGLSRLDNVITDNVISASGGTSGLVSLYDKAAGKVVVLETAGTVDLPLKESDLAATAGYLLRATAEGAP